MFEILVAIEDINYLRMDILCRHTEIDVACSFLFF